MAESDTDRRVLLVDADPQCNLTQLILGRTVKYQTNDDYGEYFRQDGFTGRYNLTLALAPIIIVDNQDIEPAQIIQVGGLDNLFLLAGDQHIYFIDQKLGRAIEDPDNFSRKFGVFYHMLKMTAAVYKIKTIIIDLPPNLSALTRLAIMTSHYFAIPCTADFFSWEAIRLLRNVFVDPPHDVEMDNDDEPTLEGLDLLQYAINQQFLRTGAWHAWYGRMLREHTRTQTYVKLSLLLLFPPISFWL